MTALNNKLHAFGLSVTLLGLTGIVGIALHTAVVQRTIHRAYRESVAPLLEYSSVIQYKNQGDSSDRKLLDSFEVQRYINLTNQCEMRDRRCQLGGVAGIFGGMCWMAAGLVTVAHSQSDSYLNRPKRKMIPITEMPL